MKRIGKGGIVGGAMAIGAMLVSFLSGSGHAGASADPFGGRVSKALRTTAKLLGKTAAKKALRPLVYTYIRLHRNLYLKHAKPLTPEEIGYLKRYFPLRLLQGVRVVERPSCGLGNRWAGATTYGRDFIIVRRGKRKKKLLKHEMVHVCQYDKLGLKGFAHRYADQFVDAGFVYKKIKFEQQARAFKKRGKGPVGQFLGYCHR